MKIYGTTMWMYRPYNGYVAAPKKRSITIEQPNNHSLTLVVMDAHCR